MKTPHKHAELIKAWADGAEIEWWNTKGNIWERPCSYNGPSWSTTDIYRIKPEPKPDVCYYVVIKCQKIKLIFDGESGEFKGAAKV